MIARRAVATPRAQRTWLQRFLVALTLGDSGRNLAEVEGCWHLHQIAKLEHELYGEILSASAWQHVEGRDRCTRHWVTVTYH